MRAARRVLVLGDDSRSCLAILRSLGRQGHQVDLAPIDFTAPCLSSRFVRKVHRLPQICGTVDPWREALRALQAKEGYDFLLPCDERSLLPLDLSREAFSDQTILAMPSSAAIRVLFDKAETRSLAQICGVPIAPGLILDPDETFKVVRDQLSPPYVLKPLRSYELDALHGRQEVIVIQDDRSLQRRLEGSRPRLLIEGFFQGKGVGLSILADGGKILRAFQHLRLRETPRSGASSYRVSTALDPALLEACERIAAATKITGLAMFEFRCRPNSSDWVLLEVNARPWGSLPLAVAAGVDFPALWLAVLSGGSPIRDLSYDVPHYGRNLTSDIYSVLDELKRPEKGLRSKTGTIVKACASLTRVVTGKESLDTFAKDDPRPGWVELQGFIGGRGRALLERRRVFRSLSQRRAGKTLRAKVNILKATAGQSRVCFVCQGNVNRSPFAAALFTKKIEEHGLSLVAASAGMIPREGRESPSLARRAAARYGVELTQHRSQYFSDELAEASDLIIVFDYKNAVAVERRYPDLRNSVCFLGALKPSDCPGFEIHDPDGESQEIYDSIFAEIASSVRCLAKSFAEVP